MNMNLTARRVDILKALETGPKSWTFLRAIYFPSTERFASDSTTSFSNQLRRMMGFNLIRKGFLGYEITEEGKRQMATLGETK